MENTIRMSLTLTGIKMANGLQSFEQIDLSEDWNIDVTVVGNNLIINISNWNNPLEPNANELFKG